MKEKDVYIEKLSQKNPMRMTFQELHDWIDYIIYKKMKYETPNKIQKDTFNHLLWYFRLEHFANQLIMAKAKSNQYFIKSMMLVLKQTHPKDVDKILEMVEKMNEEHKMELVKDETPEDAQKILGTAKKLEDEFDKNKGE